MSAIKKMEQSLPDTISLNLANLEQTISFRTRAEPILNLEIFDLLAKAAAHRQQLELVYRKPGQAATRCALVDPYHLANINGEWYLFAYDHARKDIRTFAPTRIQSARLTGQTFPRPERFSLEKRLRDSFGVHSGQGEFEVVIRFHPGRRIMSREKMARLANPARAEKWRVGIDPETVQPGGDRALGAGLGRGRHGGETAETAISRPGGRPADFGPRRGARLNFAGPDQLVAFLQGHRLRFFDALHHLQLFIGGIQKGMHQRVGHVHLLRAVMLLQRRLVPFGNHVGHPCRPLDFRKAVL